MTIEQPTLSRHRFLAGVGVGGAAVVLSACATYGADSSAESEAGSETQPEPSTPAGADPAQPAVLAATADVPVGSGIIVDDTVLTQAVAGDFKGFSNVCTHTGCTLNSVTDKTINCPCHGSKFNLDGTVAQGPAATPLEGKPIVVQGESILAG
ncbi:MAG: Rieske (2Fe-2S) protein [Mycobacterium sp.]